MRHRTFAKIAGERDVPAAGGGGDWVALEKVHGAQLVAQVQEGAVRFGKRKDWLADDEPFFGWQLVRAELTHLARAAAEQLGAPVVVLYGELFGGAYPHPEVPPVPGLQPVQTGVWYSPDLRWAVFDALLASDEDDDGELVSFTELRRTAEAAGLLLPPLVRLGKRTHVDGAPTRFPTRVPALLGLPGIDGNLAEGLVVRRDAREGPGARSSAKRKIPELDEARYDEARPWDVGRLPTDAELCAWAERLTNAARIDSAASKVGRDDRSLLLDEVELDVLLDLSAAFPALDDPSRAATEGAVRAAIRAAAAALA